MAQAWRGWHARRGCLARAAPIAQAGAALGLAPASKPGLLAQALRNDGVRGSTTS
jgi:hypothetical protein